ncbi:pentapeptide repeat-containing protein [Maridesulfovibrio sp.]|uniref:pentapeptide repeat-containing protein n=1 Tax=Maridesulfovibrio sp. TaxID=2795000 RepID=UPI0039EEF5AE
MLAILWGQCFLIFLILCVYSPKLYDYSGARAICEKMFPPSPEDAEKSPKPSSFVLWAIGIYVALFSIASARYDRAVNSYELQIMSWQNQMQTEFRDDACAYVKTLQKTQIPIRPDLFRFWNTFRSFFQNEQYDLGKEKIYQTLNTYKKGLQNADLSYTDLSGIRLIKANLTGAYLRHCNLKDSNLESANLQDTNCNGINLSNAMLISADFRDAYFSDINATEAVLFNADLRNATLDFNEFADAKSLKQTQHNSLELNIKTKYPERHKKIYLESPAFLGSGKN